MKTLNNTQTITLQQDASSQLLNEAMSKLKMRYQMLTNWISDKKDLPTLMLGFSKGQLTTEQKNQLKASLLEVGKLLLFFALPCKFLTLPILYKFAPADFFPAFLAA